MSKITLTHHLDVDTNVLTWFSHHSEWSHVGTGATREEAILAMADWLDARLDMALEAS